MIPNGCAWNHGTFTREALFMSQISM
jgi:hypothetical protein